MAVEPAWGTVGGPSGVRNASVAVKDLVHIRLVALDQLPQLGDLADLLEGVDFVPLVAIDGETGGVVATVLETRKACEIEELVN